MLIYHIRYAKTAGEFSGGLFLQNFFSVREVWEQKARDLELSLLKKDLYISIANTLTIERSKGPFCFLIKQMILFD